MIVPVVNMAGEQVSTVELPAAIFEAEINRDLMHQALVRQLANVRQGTHSTKTRGEVSRTTAKMYRQKGTGRARHGSRKAPIFVGGGVAHGPKPRKYVKDMPRKMRRAALCSALTIKANHEALVVVDDIQVETPKTKTIASFLDVVAGGRNALILLPEGNEMVELSARNLPQVKTLRAGYLNVRDLLGYEKVVLSLGALDVISGNLGYGLMLAEELEIASLMDEEE
ncbi:MAG: 50S ribosomal protein L4 [Chloroflexota bacterium]